MGPTTTRDIHSGSALTAREDQILELVGEGMTNRQIGERLGIAEKTVKNTMTAILSKLGLASRSQAAVFVTVRRLGGGSAQFAPAGHADGTFDRAAGRSSR